MEASREVLLLGSVPLSSTEEVFKTAVKALPGRLHSLPDGETGVRGNFIGWQHSVFPINVVQPRAGGQPPTEKTAFNYTVADLKPVHYDDCALESYAVFRKFQSAGEIPADVKFQVALPSPLGTVRGFVETDYCAEIEPLYEHLLLRAVRRIQDNIPHDKLVIQWDLPFEVGMLEYERGRLTDIYHAPYFSPVMVGIIDRVARLATAVDKDVELGFHLCYGDMNHMHFVQPEDAAVIVDLANQILQKVDLIHPVQYIHLPVPRDRTDAAFFKPLEDLKTGNTKLFLGLIHANDEEGTKSRLEAAKAVYSGHFGVASECGLGRTPVEELESILNITAAVS